MGPTGCAGGRDAPIGQIVDVRRRADGGESINCQRGLNAHRHASAYPFPDNNADLFANPFGFCGLYYPCPAWQPPDDGGPLGPYGTFSLPRLTYAYSLTTSATISDVAVEDDSAFNGYGYFIYPDLSYGAYSNGEDCCTGPYLPFKANSHSVYFTDVEQNTDEWDGYYVLGQGGSADFNNYWSLGADIAFGYTSNTPEPYTLTVSTVPAPATWALILLGMSLMGGAVRVTNRRRLSRRYGCQSSAAVRQMDVQLCSLE
jgi:hypothetical protein